MTKFEKQILQCKNFEEIKCVLKKTEIENFGENPNYVNFLEVSKKY